MKWKGFDHSKHISGVFVGDFGVGEDGVDTGGPTKEWLELVVTACRDKHLFYETGDGLQLSFNIQAQQNVGLHGWYPSATVEPSWFFAYSNGRSHLSVH